MADVTVPPLSPSTGGQETSFKVRADKRSGNVIVETEGRRYTLSPDEAQSLDSQLDQALQDLGIEDEDDDSASEGEDDQAAADAKDEKNMLAIMISPRMKRGE